MIPIIKGENMNFCKKRSLKKYLPKNSCNGKRNYNKTYKDVISFVIKTTIIIRSFQTNSFFQLYIAFPFPEIFPDKIF